MKKCNNCGRVDADSVLFCASCGGQDFSYQQEGEAQSAQYNFTPTQIKGKVKAWQIILIALACIAIAAAGVLAVINLINATPYTNGKVTDNVYVNEWAELRFDLSNGYKDITEDEREYYEDESSDIGFAAEKTDSSVYIALSFQDLGSTRGYSEKEGMDDFLEGYSDELKTDYGVTPTVSEYFKYSVAGKEYTTSKVEVGGIFSEYHCIRFEGEYAVILSVTAVDEAAVKEALALFEHYEGE